ncbi:MAG: hypothetical protein ACE5EA_01855 [Nitrospirota bacterium]
MYKKIVVLLLIFALIFTASSKTFAEDLPIVGILKNSLYGGVIGSILGTAVIAFTDKPSDNLNFIARGAAIGVFAGTIYGFYDVSQYYYIDDTELDSINLNPSLNSYRHPDKRVLYTVNLFRYNF